MLNGPDSSEYCDCYLQSRYSTALYFCFTGLVSVGFGNVAPHTDNEMIFSIVLMLGGCKFNRSITLRRAHPQM